MNRRTADWVRKAEADYKSANALAATDAVVNDAVCFHCQQCAEKYLKSLLNDLGRPIPRTHDLVALLMLLVADHPTLTRVQRGLHVLVRYAVETRYPGHSASKRQAVAALRWASKIRGECRRLLGLRIDG